MQQPPQSREYEQTEDGFTRKSYVPSNPSQQQQQQDGNQERETSVATGSVKDMAKNMNIPMMGGMSRTQMLLEKKKREDEERIRRAQQEEEEYEQRQQEAKRTAEEAAYQQAYAPPIPAT